MITIEKSIIDGRELTRLPALIDPHVHFRTPGLEHKENWEWGALAALAGGYTTVFDMPNTLPPCTTKNRLKKKKEVITSQLSKIGIPLRFHLYFGTDPAHLDEIPKAKEEIIGLKVFMGHTTGNLLIDDKNCLHEIFATAAAHDLLVAVHVDGEKGMAQAIELAKLHKARLYLVHVSTKNELALIRQAKQEGLSVFAEVTPHHLFLTGRAKMNPPLRPKEDVEALFAGIDDETIDTIGSDHAPHTKIEKNLPYAKAPSGVPGIETTLPLLLTATPRLSLERIISLTRTRILEIFRLPPNDDTVLVDLEKERAVRDDSLKTRCGWSPFAGKMLKGWPIYTILKGKVYEIEKL